MRKCAVIGGGLAGLSAAAFLADKDVEVHLFEASPKAGGRTYSFTDKSSGYIIDNGQHIMMGCYTETLRFLELIGASGNIDFQDNLSIPFSSGDGRLFHLKTDKGFYPLNLLVGILNYEAISLKDRMGIIRLALKLFFLNPEKLEKLTAGEWLRNEKQSSASFRAFWDIIILGALNSKKEMASAEMLASILKQIFFSGRKSSAIILPAAGLSEMYCCNAAEFITSRGGKINLSARVENVIYDNGNACKIILDDGREEEFDYLIAAIPHFALKKILPEDILIGTGDPGFVYSPILSMHIFLNKNMFEEKYYAFIDSPVHWLFNHDKHISIVISSAEEIVNLPSVEIEAVIINEIRKHFPFFSESHITGCRIIKEKRATFIPEPSLKGKRPGTDTNIGNIFIAGDWVNTGLPATIEGAVRSGRMAADAVLRSANQG